MHMKTGAQAKAHSPLRQEWYLLCRSDKVHHQSSQICFPIFSCFLSPPFYVLLSASSHPCFLLILPPKRPSQTAPKLQSLTSHCSFSRFYICRLSVLKALSSDFCQKMPAALDLHSPPKKACFQVGPQSNETIVPQLLMRYAGAFIALILC